MHEITTFLMNHELLAAGFLIVLIALIVNEIHGRATGGAKCSVHAIATLMNTHEGNVVDIRSLDDYKAGHIAGSFNMPLRELETKLQKLDAKKDKPVIVVDSVGQQGHSATTILRKNGFKNVYFLGGGMASWKQEHLPLVKA